MLRVPSSYSELLRDSSGPTISAQKQLPTWVTGSDADPGNPEEEDVLFAGKGAEKKRLGFEGASVQKSTSVLGMRNGMSTSETKVFPSLGVENKGDSARRPSLGAVPKSDKRIRCGSVDHYWRQCPPIISGRNYYLAILLEQKRR